jgi:hypothetical protein
MSQLPADCLNDIFEYLEEDNFTLHSCILVNRLWCEVSVRISWRNVQNYSTSNFSTLIACLPNESKEILNKNEIIISTPTLKFPTFNYASFCKILKVEHVYYKLELLLKNQFILSQKLNLSINIVAQEILKLFAIQIHCLKKLEISTFWQFLSLQYPTTIFISYLKANDCLKNLSELYCSSDISSEFFFQLSQVCHNLLILDIKFQNRISNGLTDLISNQKSLKYFSMMTIYYPWLQNDQIFSLMKILPNTLIKLDLLAGDNDISLSFINNLKNLQELLIEFTRSEYFIDFEVLQYTYFPQLQILDIADACPKRELLINFLEINGKTLKELYLSEFTGDSDNSLNLAIAKFCSVLNKLSTGIKNDELETLKVIFENCRYLESIKVWCGGTFLSEKEALETVLKYSIIIHEIILYYQDDILFRIFPKELESFFISWTNRIPQKSLSLAIVDYVSNRLDLYDDNMEIIEKYIKLGVIKKFKR